MPTRYLKESICTSENLIALSAEAERFFYRLIVNVDDFGRLDARPQVLRAKCFTMMEDRISFADVDAWLEELRNAQLLTRYVVNSKPYLVLNTFTEHNKPRADKSKCPNPPADTDTGTPLPEIAGNCKQMQTDASKCLPIPSYSYSNSRSNTKPAALPRNEDVTPLQVTPAAAPIVTTFTPPPSIPSFQHSTSNGYKAAAEMQARNGKLGPELRVPIANMLLKIAGLNHLADVEEDNKLLCEAHDIAIEVYGIGYKTEDDLIAAEDDWYTHDFRGQKGDRPTLAQFRKYAATYKAGKRVAPAPHATEVWG